MSSRTYAEEELMSMYVGEYYAVFTYRRPNPNAAHSASLTSGLSSPSFIYRSGWNSSGLFKYLRSCNNDLYKKFRTENRIKWSYQPCITDHNCSFRNIVAITFIVDCRHVWNTFQTRQDDSNDKTITKLPTKGCY